MVKLYTSEAGAICCNANNGTNAKPGEWLSGRLSKLNEGGGKQP
jgi:hypothetical protein